MTRPLLLIHSSITFVFIKLFVFILNRRLRLARAAAPAFALDADQLVDDHCHLLAGVGEAQERLVTLLGVGE
jgi:hypothetical protein